MKRNGFVWYVLTCGCLGGALINVGCQGLTGNTSSATNAASSGDLKSSVNHIIFMLQENRSFDTYMGKLNDYRNSQGLPQDVDGLPANATNPSFDGTTQVAAFKLQTSCTENLSASWNETHAQRNRQDPTSPTATMDGFVYTAAKFARDETAAGRPYSDLNGVRAMGYYDASALPYYYFMASQFATSDRWFAPLPTRTQANRIAMMAATSAGHAYEPTALLNLKTIWELLQNAGVSWKIYTTDGSETTFTTFTYAAAHMDHVVPIAQYFTDVAAGTLPAVAFIETGEDSGRDEHPDNNIQVGAQYAASIINALMNSPSWKDSVFFLTYDEGGGAYDHVPPMTAVSPDGIAPLDLAPTDIRGDFTITGLRVPTIIISPFVRKNFVSHTPVDSTAILRFIEVRYDLPALTQRDAAQASLLPIFKFSNPDWLTPPTPPAQGTSMPCYFNSLP